MNKEFKISIGLLSEIVKYLGKRPYLDVVVLMNRLDKLEPIVEEEKPKKEKAT